MNRNADILNELKAMDSPLANKSWQLPYAVPDGYFSTLAEALKAGVRFSEPDDPEISGLSKALPFDLPQGYFSGLASDLRDTVSKQATFEPGIQAPYSAPDTYFENLPDTLTAATKQAVEGSEQKTRNIPLRPFWKTRLTRIAAAALLLLGIGFGSYRYMQTTSPDAIAAKQLSSLDEEAIDTYMDQNVDEFDAETLEAAIASANASLPATISTLNEAEIEDYFMETGESAPNTSKTAL